MAPTMILDYGVRERFPVSSGAVRRRLAARSAGVDDAGPVPQLQRCLPMAQEGCAAGFRDGFAETLRRLALASWRGLELCCHA